MHQELMIIVKRTINGYLLMCPGLEMFVFMGYHRHDGRVGTANYWLFIPTVFCENRNLDVIREVLQDELGYSVTEKYKSFTRELILARQHGENLTDPDMHILCFDQPITFTGF